MRLLYATCLFYDTIIKAFIYSIFAFLISPITATAHSTKLEKITVTAQKREQNMQHVPVAVTALHYRDLMDAVILNISDLSASIPSLVVSTNSGPFNTSYRIRGIGNEGNIPTFEPATGLFLDGIFRSRSGIGMTDLIDIHSIEILKGPQSTLYGKNVTAGVISVKTKKPSDNIELMAETSHGSYDFISLKGSLNLPLSENVAVRISTAAKRRDKTQRNLLGAGGRDIDQTSTRIQTRFYSNNRIELNLAASSAARDMAVNMGDMYYSPPLLRIIDSAGGRIERNNAYDNRVEYQKNVTFSQITHASTATLKYIGDKVRFTAISGFEDYEINLDYQNVGQLPFEVIRFYDPQKGTSFSHEFRFYSDDEHLFSWITGLFYYQSDYQRGGSRRGEFELLDRVEEFGGAVVQELATQGNLTSPIPVEAPVLGVEGDKGFFRARLETQALASYAHISIDLSNDWSIAAGIRYFYEEKSGDYIAHNLLSEFGCVPPSNLNMICTVSPDGLTYEDEEEWNSWTGTFSASYSPTANFLLYGNYATGFKSGGFNLEFGNAPKETRPYDDEGVVNLELGWKSDLFDRRLRFNGSLFHTTYDNY